MSVVLANTPTTAPAAATKPNRRRQRKPAKKQTRIPEKQSIITKSTRKAVRGGQGKPDALQSLVRELISGNAAVYTYIASLCTPGVPGRPPLSLGDWILDTGIYEFPLDFTLTAGAAGFVYCALVLDNWLNGVDNQLAVTPGSTCWTSGTNPTSIPPVGGAAGADHIRRTISAPSDLTLVTGMQWRMVANILEVYPESVETNTSGSIMLAACASPTSMQNAALNNVDYAAIAAHPQIYVNHNSYPATNWTSGHTARVHIAPVSSDCLMFKDMVAAASTVTTPTFGACMVGSGFQPGEVVHVRVWTKYEISRAAGRSIDEVAYVPQRAEMNLAAKPMQALARIPHMQGSPATHAARPIFAMEAVRPGSTSGLSSQLSEGLGSMLNTGLKAASSFLPGIVGKGIGALMSLFK